MHCAAVVSKRVTLRHASTRRRRAVTATAGGSSPSSPVQTPPHHVMRIHGVNCVTSPPVCIAGPALAPANNDHQGRGEHNEVDKSSTMMMDCAAIKARGLKQSHRGPRRQEDSTRPAGAARCSASVFFLCIRGP